VERSSSTLLASMSAMPAMNAKENKVTLRIISCNLYMNKCSSKKQKYQSMWVTFVSL
jgi:hypothetical protein